MNLPSAIALIAAIFIVCSVLAPLLFAGMPSFEYGANPGTFIDAGIRLGIFGGALFLLFKIFRSS